MKQLWMFAGVGMAVTVFTLAGCRNLDLLDVARPSTDPVVFDDALSPGVDFQVFQGAYLEALSVDPTEAYSGVAALKIVVPAGGWSGGAFTTNLARDLSPYNALTFWAKSNVNMTLNTAGLGNDNTGTSKFSAEWSNAAVTTDWKRFIVPIPDPTALGAERGLFYFAEAAEPAEGQTIWFDEIAFSKVSTISNPRPFMPTQSLEAFVGSAVPISGTRVTFNVNGKDQVIVHQAGYFHFDSTHPDVAEVVNGDIRAKGPGTTVITAKLDTVAVTGTITVTVTSPPSIAAPVPTEAPNQVISLFSDSYTNVPVDTWSADWDKADTDDLVIQGNHTKAYTNLSYAGIEFASHTLDITAMNYFHLDVWIPEGLYLKVKLVDFGEDGTYGGAPDNEHELALTADTTPALSFGTWASLDIPLSDFTNLITRKHLAQLILSADSKTVYVDNLYFHQ